MNPLFRIDFSISDSLKIVRKSVLIYETIIIEEPAKKFKVEYTEEAMKDALRVIKNLFLQW